jgi:hypothetical protein
VLSQYIEAKGELLKTESVFNKNKNCNLSLENNSLSLKK